MRMAKIRYIGPFDAVEIDVSTDSSGQWEKVQKNHQVEVPDVVAHGRPTSTPDIPPNMPDGISQNPAYDVGMGGLLAQTDNWELVAPKATEQAKAD
jgi:hypothetical protein